MKVAFFSTKSYDRQSFDLLSNIHSHEITYFEPKLDSNTVALTQDFDAICTFVNDYLDEKVLLKLSNMVIKNIVLRCAGYNQVDLKKAAELGIRICRVPAYSPEAVAEHALALLMTLSRKTHKAYNRVRENNYSIEGLTGFNIHGKTAGVIGTGAIGRAFCKIMLGMGCRVLAYDINESEDLKKLGITYLPLNDLLSQSDIISLHCPLTAATFHLINEITLRQMKDGVVARLMTFPNVLITGHQAFLTNEALMHISETTILNLDELEKGKELSNEVKYRPE